MGMSQDARREMLFGPPNQPTITSNASNEYAKEFNIDPFARAYYGTNTRIQTVLIQRITEAELFMTRILLPITAAPAGGQITISKLEFHAHEFGEVPQTGTVRLTTSSFTQWKQGMQRRGLGFMMEDGYAVTELGVMTYFASIAQITNAANEAMCLNGYRALLDTDVPSPADHSWMRAAGLDLVQDVEDIFKERIEMFAIVNKPAGITRLCDKVRVLMKKRGVTVNAMIVPFGIRDLIKQNYNSNAIYNFISGARNMQMPDFLGMISDIQVFESNLYTYDAGDNKGEMKNDPLVRNSAIGEKFSLSYGRVMKQFSGDYKKYSSDAFTATVLDHDNDRRGAISQAELLKGCGLFDSNGEPTTAMGEAWFTGAGMSIYSYLESVGVLATALSIMREKGVTAPEQQVSAAAPPNPDIKRGGRRGFGDMSSDSDTEDSAPYLSNSKPMFTQRVLTLYATEGNPNVPRDVDAKSAADMEKELKGTVAEGVWGSMTKRGGVTFDAAEIRLLFGAFPMAFPPNLRKALQFMYRSISTQRALYSAFATPTGIDVHAPRLFLYRLYHDIARVIVATGNVHAADRSTWEKDTEIAQFDASLPKLSAYAPSLAGSMYAFIKQNHPTELNKYKEIAKAIDGFLLNNDPNLAAAPASLGESRSSVSSSSAGYSAGVVALIMEGLAVITHSAQTKEQAFQAIQVAQRHTSVFEGDADSDDAKAFKDAMLALPFAKKPSGSQGEAKGADGKQDPVAVLKGRPINKKSFEWMLANNIPLGMGFSLRRPFIQYRMGSIIFLVAGSETGNTFFSGADFQLGNDVYRKVLHGNFTANTGTVIKERKNVMVVHDAVCLDYLYGGGNTIFDPNDAQTRQSFEGGELHKCPSIFVVPLRPNEEDGNKFGDLTGRMPASNKPGETAMPSAPAFEMADAFATMWNFHHAVPYFQTSAPRAPTSAINTALAQGQLHYPKYGPNGFDETGNIVSSGGHWSDEHTFDGCMPMRCGKAGGLPSATVIKTIITK